MDLIKDYEEFGAESEECREAYEHFKNTMKNQKNKRNKKDEDRDRKEYLELTKNLSDIDKYITEINEKMNVYKGFLQMSRYEITERTNKEINDVIAKLEKQKDGLKNKYLESEKKLINLKNKLTKTEHKKYLTPHGYINVYKSHFEL